MQKHFCSPFLWLFLCQYDLVQNILEECFEPSNWVLETVIFSWENDRLKFGHYVYPELFMQKYLSKTTPQKHEIISNQFDTSAI